jgi:broad specificity polyphosphatase/5'/3'-nucleotidase SurE
VLNINVPNANVDELKGWRRTEMANQSGRTSSQVGLVPKIGHENAFNVTMNWGQPIELPEHTDIGAVQRGMVSVTWLSPIVPVDPGADNHAEHAIDRLFRS